LSFVDYNYNMSIKLQQKHSISNPETSKIKHFNCVANIYKLYTNDVPKSYLKLWITKNQQKYSCWRTLRTINKTPWTRYTKFISFVTYIMIWYNGRRVLQARALCNNNIIATYIYIIIEVYNILFLRTLFRPVWVIILLI